MMIATLSEALDHCAGNQIHEIRFHGNCADSGIITDPSAMGWAFHHLIQRLGAEHMVMMAPSITGRPVWTITVS